MCIGCFFEAKNVSVIFSCPVMFPKYARCYVGGNNIKINTLLYISGNKKLTKWFIPDKPHQKKEL